jgi:hypothetical protein
VSVVASNCSSADPNWNPCVHSVQPRARQRPSTVNTGDPSSGRQAASVASILAADAAKSASMAGSRAVGVSAATGIKVQTTAARAASFGEGFYPLLIQ